MESRDGWLNIKSGDIVLLVVTAFGLGIHLGISMTPSDPSVPHPSMYISLTFCVPMVVRLLTIMLPTVRKFIYGRA